MVEEALERGNEADEGKPRRRRWVLPTGAAALVVGVVGVVAGMMPAQPREDGVPPAAGSGEPAQDWTQPHFIVMADRLGDEPTAPAWFQIYDIADGGRQRLVDAVQPPSPSSGTVTSIVAGPDSTFLVATWRVESCETVLYRFTLTDDGHATGLAPLLGGRIPALAGGLAISPDGRRIAYATGPCGDDGQSLPPVEAPIALAVLDTGTGEHRTWTTNRPTVVGEIVWADDNRTLGYTTAEIGPTGAALGPVRVTALDTDAPDTDLLAGRVLFTQPDRADTVTTAVMNPDGRTGYGVLRDDEPPSTVLFSFGEGQPVRVTKTIPDDPDTASMVSFSGGSGPRYACLGGVDAFGRLDDGELNPNSVDGFEVCTAAYA